MSLIALIPLIPFIGFLINGLGFRKISKTLVPIIGTGASLISFLLVVIVYLQIGWQGHYFEAKLSEYLDFFMNLNQISTFICQLFTLIFIYITSIKNYLTFIKKSKKIIFFLLFILATVITPPDLFSQIILGSMIIIIYVLLIIFMFQYIFF